ncbi:hypothetical protein CFP56_006935, partial [Quercus suber]
MPIPHYISNGSQKLYLEYFGESSERLHIITSCNPIKTNPIGRDKPDWFVKYHGNLDFYLLRMLDIICTRPLCLVEGEKQEGNLVLAKLGKVISYNLKDKALKVLCDFNSWRSLL